MLASRSPRRAELLSAAGFTFEVLAADIDERMLPDESPEAYVRRLAAEKSAAALRLLAGHGTPGMNDPADPTLVLGADTVVVIDGEILGKPRDDRDAERMLQRLSGRRHQVLTAVSLRTLDLDHTLVETSDVDFAVLTGAEIAWYVESGEGRDKAGGYAIQGLASRFIPAVRGSYSNVVGLPVAAVYELLIHCLASSHDSTLF